MASSEKGALGRDLQNRIDLYQIQRSLSSRLWPQLWTYLCIAVTLRPEPDSCTAANFEESGGPFDSPIDFAAGPEVDWLDQQRLSTILHAFRWSPRCRKL